jgi:hypothetical protein
MAGDGFASMPRQNAEDSSRTGRHRHAEAATANTRRLRRMRAERSELHDVRCTTMTDLQISLPDDVARSARAEGLLDPEALEQLLRERLRELRLARLDAARERLAATPPAPMTAEEIQAEIDAYRAEQRRAAGA